MIVFQVSLNNYTEENTSDTEDFHSFTIFQPFQFVAEQRKTCGNESYEKKTKHIYASAAALVHIRIGKSKSHFGMAE